MFNSEFTEYSEIHVSGNLVEIEAVKMPNCYLARFRRPKFTSGWTSPSLHNPQTMDEVVQMLREHLEDATG